MPWAAAAAGVAAAGTAYSSGQAADAASEAAQGQQDAAALSRADQLKLMAQQRADAAPYRNSGYNALNQLNYLMGLGSPTSTAKTLDYFDPDKYKQWRIDQMTAQATKDFKNPEKLARVIEKRTARINAAMSNPANAWSDFNARVATKPKLKNEDFWKVREGAEGTAEQGGSGTEYGFLQQRFNNDVFEKDPGYQFRMDEGNRAIEGGAAARGGLLSGAAAKAMQKYSQGFASNEYGNAYNRFTGDQQNMYNRLSQLAGTGQQQMNQTNQMQQQGLNNASSYLQDAAAANASGIIGASNARQSGYGQIGNTLMDAYGIYAANKGSGSGGGGGGWNWGSGNGSPSGGSGGGVKWNPVTGSYE